MARKKAKKPERRPRHEIDRNYFVGDILIKTGVAVAIAIGAITFLTPFTFRDAIADRMYDYLAVMIVFGALGLASFLYGRFLRRQATHWDFD